jgi:hypothetical protein
MAGGTRIRRSKGRLYAEPKHPRAQ